jgi:hypothetical protein
MALLAALSVGSLGSLPAGAEGSLAMAVLTTPNTRVAPLTSFTVEVVVRSEQPIQAVDLAVAWDGARLLGVDVAPHAEFDDDEGLLLQPLMALGSFSRIVDVRHGGPGASGIFRIATLRFISGPTPGPTAITIKSLGLGFRDGGEPAELWTMPLEIRVGS